MLPSNQEGIPIPLTFFLATEITAPTFMTSNKGWIFGAGVVALALSLFLWFSGYAQAAIFVGLWVPSLWILADLVDQVEAATS